MRQMFVPEVAAHVRPLLESMGSGSPLMRRYGIDNTVREKAVWREQRGLPGERSYTAKEPWQGEVDQATGVGAET